MSLRWAETTIGEIAIVDWGNTSLTKKAFVEDGPYLGVSAAGCDGRMKHAEHKKFTPVLSAIGAQCGRMFLPDEDFTAIKNTITLTPKSDEIDPIFLFYLMTFVELPQRGAGQPFISKGDIQKFTVSVPPLEEQKRIVAVLEQAFAAVDRARANAEANLADAKDFFPAILGDAFKPDAPWPIKTVSEFIAERIIERPIDGNHGETHPKKADFVSAGVPFVMASDLQNGLVDQDGCYFISRRQADALRKGFARDGDVLLSHKGTIGRAAILNTSLDYVMLTPQVTYYRVLDEAKLDRDFLFFCFQSADFQKQLNEIAGIGATRAYIGITRQHELQLPLPTLETQKKLVARFRDAEGKSSSLVKKYEVYLEDLDDLRQSILQKAFAGKLT